MHDNEIVSTRGDNVAQVAIRRLAIVQVARQQGTGRIVDSDAGIEPIRIGQRIKTGKRHSIQIDRNPCTGLHRWQAIMVKVATGVAEQAVANLPAGEQRAATTEWNPGRRGEGTVIG